MSEWTAELGSYTIVFEQMASKWRVTWLVRDLTTIHMSRTLVVSRTSGVNLMSHDPGLDEVPRNSPGDRRLAMTAHPEISYSPSPSRVTAGTRVRMCNM